MFSLKRSDHLVFDQMPTSSSQQKQPTIHHHIMDDYDSTNLTPKDTGKRHRIISSAAAAAGDSAPGHNSTGNDNKQRRVSHRDAEKQRRQEMAKLYASLRSLLPLEYIKGKRSISDHMHQAMSYINHLQGNIKELDMRRDKLKKLYDKSYVVESNKCLGNNIVTVNSRLCGIEILVSSSLKEKRLPLSRVMEVLVEEEGLNIVNCFSTTVNQRVLHTIQAEVSNLTCIDLSALQQKLSDRCN